jgi:hypothetical protein
MVRTITGNSAHYVVTADGLVIDALPGMVGPRLFLDWIERMDQLFQEAAKLPNPTEASEVMRQYHSRFGSPALVASLNSNDAANQVERNSNPIASSNGQEKNAINVEKIRLTASKGVFEQPMVKQVAPGQTNINAIAKRIESFNHPDSSAVVDLSSASIALIAAENTKATNQAKESDSMNRLLANFKQTIADDEKQNEQVFHKTIHGWLAETPQIDLETLNNRIYEQLFEMPSDDPWLGLASSDYYSGLCRGGLHEGDRPSSTR